MPKLSQVWRSAWLLKLARRELGPLAMFLGLAALALTFLNIASEVGEGETHAFDSAILYALRVPGHPGQPIGPWWLTMAATDFTSIGSVTVLAVVVVIVSAAFLLLKRRRQAMVLFLSSGLGLLLSGLLKLVYARERPPMELHVVKAVNASFPSGHAMLSAVVFLTLGALVARFADSRRLQAFAMGWAVALTVLIGLTRVYLGVHWPTDVLAGWCVGAAWAAAWWLGELIWERSTGRRV